MPGPPVPSALRTITLAGTGPTKGTNSWQFQKTNNQNEWWWLDFTSWVLDQSQGQTNALAQAYAAVTSGDGQLVITDTVVVGNSVGILFGAATAGESYTVSVTTITTFSPDTELTAEAKLSVSSAATVPVAEAGEAVSFALSANGFQSLLALVLSAAATATPLGTGSQPTATVGVSTVTTGGLAQTQLSFNFGIPGSPQGAGPDGTSIKLNSSNELAANFGDTSGTVADGGALASVAVEANAAQTAATAAATLATQAEANASAAADAAAAASAQAATAQMAADAAAAAAAQSETDAQAARSAANAAQATASAAATSATQSETDAQAAAAAAATAETNAVNAAAAAAAAQVTASAAATNAATALTNANAAATVANNAQTVANAAAANAATAYTLALAALPATALPTAPVPVFVPGSKGFDGSSLTPVAGTSTWTPYMLAAIQGDTVPHQLFENNATFSCRHKYWTAAGAAAAVAAGDSLAVQDCDTLFEAARAYSTGGSYVLFPHAVFPLKKAHSTFTGGERLMGHPFHTVWEKSFTIGGNSGTFAGFHSDGVWIDDVHIANFHVRPVNSTYVDFLTGLVITSPNHDTSVTAGDFTGCGPFLGPNGFQANIDTTCGWQTAAARVSPAGGTTVYFDTLPPGYSTLAAANAALANYQLFNAYAKLIGATIVPGSIAAVTDGLGGSYMCTLSAPLSDPLFGAIPAQSFLPATSSRPSQMFRQAIPAQMAQVFASVSQFHSSCDFSFLCTNLRLENCVSEGSGSRSFFIGGDGFVRDCRVKAPTRSGNLGQSDTAGFRYIGGLPGSMMVVSNFDCCSSDDAFQATTGTSYGVNGFGATSNLDCNIIYNGGRAQSFGGRAVTGGIEVPNSQQREAWVTTNGVTQGNVLLMPLSAIPSGLTVANLQQSAPPYTNTFDYTGTGAGYVVCNGTRNYTLTTPGLPDPNGNGPTGTGSGIVDGTCVWAYAGPGNTQSVYSTKTNVLAFGCYVTQGTTSDGTTVTIPLATPNVANSIINTIAGGSNLAISFTIGTPPCVFTASARMEIIGVHCRSYGPVTITTNASDTQGCMSCRVAYCTIDSRYAFTNATTNLPYLIALASGPTLSGGIDFDFVGNTVYGAQAGILNTTGLINNLRIKGNKFPQVLNTNLTLAPFVLSGVVQGLIEDNDIWCMPQAAVQPVETITVGQADGQTLGIPQPGGCIGVTFRANRFHGVADGMCAVRFSYANQCDAYENKFFQATLLGSSGANGQGFIVNSNNTTDIRFGNNNFSQIDGAPYTWTPASNNITLMFGDRYNAAPVQTFTLPAVYMPGLPAAIAAYLSGLPTS